MPVVGIGDTLGVAVFDLGLRLVDAAESAAELRDRQLDASGYNGLLLPRRKQVVTRAGLISCYDK